MLESQFMPDRTGLRIVSWGEVMSRLTRAVYETLDSSDKPLHLKAIYEGVKQRVPDLCDDSLIPCPYCRLKHTKWTHDVRWALQSLKSKTAVQRVGKGTWKTIEPVKPQHVPMPTRQEPSEHEQIKSEIKEIGETLGKMAIMEHQGQPYVFDVVWKDVGGVFRRVMSSKRLFQSFSTQRTSGNPDCF